MLKRRDRIKELSAKRREELELSRMLCIFNRDVGEVTNESITEFHLCDNIVEDVLHFYYLNS